MPGLVRMSVSLEPELLERIDQLRADGRFASRSDAFRRLFQDILTASAWRAESCQGFAILALVYDGSCPSLTKRLTELQHAELDLIIATTRVCVDRDNRLEVLILHGNRKRLDSLATRLSGLKGVHAGRFVVSTPEPTQGNGMSDSPRGPDGSDTDCAVAI
jgi:CopG family transcriptional regulator, nickel-responsive regulator